MTDMMADTSNLEVREGDFLVFEAFPKIPRLNRPWVITEKIDGTNAQVEIFEDTDGSVHVVAGSRNRYIYPGKDDNHGFAGWVAEHRDELVEGLGVGVHYGEWWGAGIGKRYPGREKSFTLFNVARWHWLFTNDLDTRPDCCGVVPVLATCADFLDLSIEVPNALAVLRAGGSLAATGCKAEGLVVFSTAARQMFKVTLEGDEAPKLDNRTH